MISKRMMEGYVQDFADSYRLFQMQQFAWMDAVAREEVSIHAIREYPWAGPF